MSSEKHLSFSEHLVDLRSAVKRAALSIFFGFLICWGFAEDIFNYLRSPIDRYFPTSSSPKERLSELLTDIAPHLTPDQITVTGQELSTIFQSKSPLYFTGPFEPFFVYLKVALLGGLFVAFPFVFYFLWQFIQPALHLKERKYVIITVIFASILFIGGALVGYFQIFPVLIEFALSYAKEGLTPLLSIDAYFKIFSRMLLGFGIIFELPLVLLLLSLLKMVTAKGLLKFSRIAIVLVFVASALITPPDVYSQILISIPLLGLYYFSIVLIVIVERFRDRSTKSEDSD